MNDTNQTAPGKAAGQIKKLRELYVQLESHARIGLTLFQRGEIDAFDDNWQKREAVFAKLTTLGHKLEPVFADWVNVRAAMSPLDAKQSGENMDNIRHLANSIKQFDDQLRPLLENSKHDVRGTLQKSPMAEN